MNIHEIAARALLTRSRSKKELFDYLKRKGFDESKIDGAIKELENCGYLSDERFCEEYMRYAFGKKWGKLRVFKELKTKGVSQDIIEDTYCRFLDSYEDEGYESVFNDGIETDEYERAATVAGKIVSGAGEITEKLKGRVARRLAGYGYSPDIIYRVLGELNELR